MISYEKVLNSNDFNFINNYLKLNGAATLNIPVSITKTRNKKYKDSDLKAEFNLIIKFKTDSEGLKIAKKHLQLAKNQNVKLNIKFEKL